MIIDCDYPRFLEDLYRSRVGLAEASYSEQLAARAEALFGDAPAQAAAIRRRDHEAVVVHANAAPMQRAWAAQHGRAGRRAALPDRLHRSRSSARIAFLDPAVVVAQSRAARPDVILVQCMRDLPHKVVRALTEVAPVVGVIASPLPSDDDLSPYRLLLSSLPNFVDRFRRCGKDADLLPLGFDPVALTAVPEGARDIGVSFVGSLGRHHARRRELLEAVAERTEIHIWSEEALARPGRSVHHGPAWGRDMYAVLAQSLVTINVHIDVAGVYANNLRLFEATGMGAALITEAAPNLSDYFVAGAEALTYRAAAEMEATISSTLENAELLAGVAMAGQRRTLRDHTWDARAEQLIELLAGRGISC